MTYSLTIPAGSASFTITADSPRDLGAMFEELGGDASELVRTVKESARDPFVEKMEIAVATESQLATPAEAVHDPWADDATSTPTARPSSNPDPWADDGVTTTAAPASNEGVTKTTDRFGREFTLNLPEAPECECNQPAAKMKAKGQKSGKVYHKWVCAKGTGSQWKDKCDYDEFC